MKIDAIKNWNGLPFETEKFKGEGPFEVDPQDIVQLVEAGWNVMIKHVGQRQPTRREQKQGAKPVPPLIFIYVDKLGFYQR